MSLFKKVIRKVKRAIDPPAPWQLEPVHMWSEAHDDVLCGCPEGFATDSDFKVTCKKCKRIMKGDVDGR